MAAHNSLPLPGVSSQPLEVKQPSKPNVGAVILHHSMLAEEYSSDNVLEAVKTVYYGSVPSLFSE